MVLVIGFGTAHAVFLIPVILSLIGPTPDVSETIYSVTRDVTKQPRDTDGGHVNGVTKCGESMSYDNPTFINDAHLGYMKY